MRSAVLLIGWACAAGCSFDDGGLPGTLPAADAAERPDAPVVDAALIDARPRPDAPPADAAFVCPAGYTRNVVTGSAYRLVEQSRGWAAAEDDCENDSAGLTHLVVVDDGFEIAELSAIAQVPEVWVGTSDRVEEGVFRQVTGELPGFLPFGPGEPNDEGLGGEDCVELNEELFNDKNCLALLFYVCECDGRPADDRAF
jgi:hypothetical protein